MIYMLTVLSTIENAFKLIGLVIVFIIILAGAYFTSRFVGSSTVSQSKNRNIKVIETFKIAPNRYIQIIEVSDKYIVIGVSKEHIEYLTEVEADKVLKLDGEITPLNFKDILENLKEKKDILGNMKEKINKKNK